MKIYYSAKNVSIITPMFQVLCGLPDTKWELCTNVPTVSDSDCKHTVNSSLVLNYAALLQKRANTFSRMYSYAGEKGVYYKLVCFPVHGTQTNFMSSDIKRQEWVKQYGCVIYATVFCRLNMDSKGQIKYPTSDDINDFIDSHKIIFRNDQNDLVIPYLKEYESHPRGWVLRKYENLYAEKLQHWLVTDKKGEVIYDSLGLYDVPRISKAKPTEQVNALLNTDALNDIVAIRAKEDSKTDKIVKKVKNTSNTETSNYENVVVVEDEKDESESLTEGLFIPPAGLQIVSLF